MIYVPGVWTILGSWEVYISVNYTLKNSVRLLVYCTKADINSLLLTWYSEKVAHLCNISFTLLCVLMTVNDIYSYVYIFIFQMPITTKVVGSNPVHCEVYSIQHYVIKFVSDLQQIDGFLRVLRFPPPIKLTATI